MAIDSIPEGYRKITARQMYEIESKDRSFAWTKVLPKSVLRMPVPHPEREGNIQFGSLLALAQRNMRSEGHYHMLRLPPAFWKCAKKAGNDEHFFVAAGNSISMWDIGHYRKETDSIKRTMAALRSNRQLFDMFWKLISTPDYSISQISMPGRTAHLDAHLNELFGRTIFQMADVGCAANAEDYPAISTIETKKNCPSAVLTAVDIHNPKDIKPALENQHIPYIRHNIIEQRLGSRFDVVRMAHVLVHMPHGARATALIHAMGSLNNVGVVITEHGSYIIKNGGNPRAREIYYKKMTQPYPFKKKS